MQIQKIQLTAGCPNKCQYCYEPTQMQYFKMPELTGDYIQILDMNFLANPKALEHINELGKYKKPKELVCGIDYRRLTQELATALKKNKFIKIRWAWDYQRGLQRKQRKTFLMLVKAGYIPEDLGVFILANWKIPFVDCVFKLDLLKVWNVKALDCCFDGGYKIAKPHYWTPEQINRFRVMCRKHNIIVNFKIDPEFK